MAYLVQYDSTYGKFKGNVSHRDNKLIVNGQIINVFLSKYLKSINFNISFYFIFRKDPSKIPWDQVDMFFFLSFFLS
jgi:hypothetical protein